MNKLLVFQTDFGLDDGAIGAMEGVAFCVDKDLNIRHLTHNIPPYNIFEASESDTSFYNRDTDGKREITLSTCTDDSSARLIIEARE